VKTNVEHPETEIHQSVIIPAGRERLSGDLDVPAGARGLVLFAHGSGSSRNSPRNRFVAETIRDAGIGTLLFDLLTEAEEAEDRFTGHLRFNIDLLAGRLAEATKWVGGEPALNHLGIGYFGSSTGAAAALIAATTSTFPVQAIVSRGGRPDLARESLPRVTAPTLLIVGGLDEVVIDLNRRAFEQLRCDKRLEIIPGATHLFEEKGALAQVARLAAEWFRKYLHLR
jgi:pimeloyl-ACP methyl ester carboxylesterase